MYEFGIVDADTLPYQMGNKYDATAFPSEVSDDVDRVLRQLHRDIKTEDCRYYLTDSKSNFRNYIANIKEYKGQASRKKDKPYYFNFVRDYLLEEYDAKMCYGHEADDEISDILIDSCDKGVLVSIDKDLDCAHGYHFKPKWARVKKAEHYYMTELESLMFYHKQVLTGDSTDNIGGARGIGKSKADKILEGCTTAEEMRVAVEQTYLSIYGKDPVKFKDWRGRDIQMNWEQIMKENQQLIFMGMKNRPKFNYEDNYELL